MPESALQAPHATASGSLPDGQAALARENDAKKTRLRHLQKIAVHTLASIFIAMATIEGLARVIVIAGHPSHGRPEVDVKMAIARSRSPVKKQLLFLGSSFMQRAIYTERLRTVLFNKGIQAYPKNLAVPYSWAAENLAILDQAVKSCEVAPVVFMDLKEECFLPKFYNKIGKRRSLAFWNTYTGRSVNPSLDLKEKCLLFLEQHFCLVRDRHYLRDVVFYLFSTIFDFDKKYWSGYPIGTHNEYTSFGTQGYFVTLTADEFRKSTDEDGKYFEWDEDAEKTWSLEYCKQFTDFCKARDIPLVLMWMPECTPAGAPVPVRRNSELKKRYQALADNNNVWFLDMHDIDQNYEHFNNRRHLNVMGSVVATDWLADRLTKDDLIPLLQREEPIK